MIDALILFGFLVTFPLLCILDAICYGKIYPLYTRKFGWTEWLGSKTRSIANLPGGAIYVWLRYNRQWKALPDRAEDLFF
jgi:hypothetical protein